MSQVMYTCDLYVDIMGKWVNQCKPYKKNLKRSKQISVMLDKYTHSTLAKWIRIYIKKMWEKRQVFWILNISLKENGNVEVHY